MDSASVTEPQLPRDYELVRRDSAPDVLALGGELAAAGAEEGTLVWALHQSAGRMHGGGRWHSSDGDLHCALVLRPEFARAQSLQLVAVAACSLGAALSDAVSPLTALHYRWPDAALLREARVANIGVAAQPAGRGFEWLVLGLDVNLLHPPAELQLSAAAVHPDGDCEVTREQLLEDFTRYFLRSINVWAEAGFSPILDSWRRRMAGLQQFRSIRLGSQSVDGVLAEVDDSGAAVLDAGGQRRIVSLAEYFGYDP